jgi:hypothetical protein
MWYVYGYRIKFHNEISINYIKRYKFFVTKFMPIWKKYCDFTKFKCVKKCVAWIRFKFSSNFGRIWICKFLQPGYSLLSKIQDGGFFEIRIGVDGCFVFLRFTFFLLVCFKLLMACLIHTIRWRLKNLMRK